MTARAAGPGAPSRRRLVAALAAGVLAPAAFGQARMKTVAYLSRGADPSWLPRLLASHGHVEGRNLRFVVRVASDDSGQRDEQAAELVRLPADVLVSFGASNINALARATRTIPIVCGGTADPIRVGYAKTLRRPGGNITGLSLGVPEMAGVTTGLMRAILPGMKGIVTIVRRTPGGNEAEGWGPIIGALEEAARGAGYDWETVAVGPAAELEALAARLDRRSTFVNIVNWVDEAAGKEAVVAIMLRHRIPSLSAGDKLARDGLLLHYSLNHADFQRRIAAIVDKLLRGASAAETPFELPDRTTFIVNRGTARAIGITLPPEVLARATEIIG